MSYFIGIDVSKEKLDCACLRNKEQKKARIMACSNNAIGFKLLVEWSEKTTGLLIKRAVFYHRANQYLSRKVGCLSLRFRGNGFHGEYWQSKKVCGRYRRLE
jgi:hypothetical protein